MKKFLSILALMLFFSAPAFAMCPCDTCPKYVPKVTTVAVPIVESCLPACPCVTCNPCITGAAVTIVEPCAPACPCITCNPCLTGAAYPVIIRHSCSTCF